jgi:hypothetical protein
MQIDLDLSKDLSEAFFNPRASSFFSEPGDFVEPLGSPLGRP